jgi:Fur family transcriptional regulator, ferric uptake regulator
MTHVGESTLLHRAGYRSFARSALTSCPVAATSSVHNAVALRLAGLDQRYTTTRRLVVDALATAGRPLTVPEIVASDPRLPQSSAYRIATTLIEAGVLRRVAGTQDHGRFELAEELSGHHHHLVCARCGKVEDVHPSPRLEQALGDAAGVVADELGYEITEHRLDLLGYCPACRTR